MLEVRVTEALWASNMVLEGIVEQWLSADGSDVKAGDAIAEITIEGALHEIIAPQSGRLLIVTAANSMIEPGSVLATLSVDGPAVPAEALGCAPHGAVGPARVQLPSASGRMSQ